MRVLRGVFALAVTIGLVVVAGFAPRPALAIDIVVGDTYDCTHEGLTDAISDALPGDVITFDCDSSTISFAGDIPIAIDTAITIDGRNGDESMMLDGQEATSFFSVESGGNLTLQHLTLQHGFSTEFGGAILVYPEGQLTVEHTIFDGNSASLEGSNATYASGGAIYNEGTLTIRDSVFTDNYAEDRGGAIENAGTVTVWNSLFENNLAHNGGAIDSSAEYAVTIVRSSFVNNRAGDGGAIYSGGVEAIDDSKLSILASTFTGNHAVEGSAISMEASDAHIAWSTIVNPIDGVSAIDAEYASNLELEGLLLAGVGASCGLSSSTLTDRYSHTHDTSCGLSGVGSVEGVANELGPIVNTIVDGVKQVYYSLAESSPAINSGPQQCDTAISDGQDTDQLGNARPDGAACDIGAIEGIIVHPATLCADQWSGQLRASNTCTRAETLIAIPADGPLDICVNQWNGAAHVGSNCSGSEYQLTLTGFGDATACVNIWNGSLRISDQCNRSEREIVL